MAEFVIDLIYKPTVFRVLLGFCLFLLNKADDQYFCKISN